MERAVIIQVDVSGTPGRNPGKPTNPDAVLTVDFNFLDVKLNKKINKLESDEHFRQISVPHRQGNFDCSLTYYNKLI